LQLADNIL